MQTVERRLQPQPPPYGETASTFRSRRLAVNLFTTAGMATGRRALLGAILLLQTGSLHAAEVERRLVSMGTTLDIAIEAPHRALALEASERAVAAVAAVERRLSTWRSDSELAAFNRSTVGEAQRLSRRLGADLSAAVELWRRTAGAFDPAIAALVAAWDLRGRGRVPSDSELAAARAVSGMHHVVVSGSQATRAVAGVGLEEGGFGKGVALDEGAAAARAAGARCVRLDFGGQVLVAGTCGTVTVAVADPGHRERAAWAVSLTSGSLATSGNSERGRMVAGVRIGHILDPRSGRPAAEFGSVTVWAPEATVADALATALYVMGPAKGLAWLEREGGAEALFLLVGDAGPRVLATAGMTAAMAGVPLGTSDGPSSAENTVAHNAPRPQGSSFGGRE